MAIAFDLTVTGNYADGHTEQLLVLRINTGSASVGSRPKWVQDMRALWEQKLHDDPDSGDVAGLTSFSFASAQVQI